MRYRSYITLALPVTILFTLGHAAPAEPGTGRIITVASAGQWDDAFRKARSGDTIRLSRDLTAASGRWLPAGATLDLGGHKLTMTGADAHGIYLAGGGAVRNGRIAGVLYTLWNWAGGTGFVFEDLRIDGAATAIKLAADPTKAEARNIRIERVWGAARPDTLLTFFDLGPGKTRNIAFRDVKAARPAGGDHTAGDGIAVEKGYGLITLERVDVSGFPGDGVDLKAGGVRLSHVRVHGITRNPIKIWGDGKTASTLDHVITRDNGLDAVVASGPLTIRDSYFEGGNIGAYAFEFLGNTSATIRNTAFTRKTTDPAKYNTLLTSAMTARVRFEDCTFWNGPLSNVVNVMTGPVSMVTAQLSTQKRWPGIFTRCRYKDADPPIINAPRPPRL